MLIWYSRHFIRKINLTVPVNSFSRNVLNHKNKNKNIILNGNMSNLSEDSAISQEPLSYKDSYFPLAKKSYLKYAVSNNGMAACRSYAKYAN